MTELAIATHDLWSSIERVAEQAKQRKMLKPERLKRLDEIKREYHTKRKRD